MVSSELIKYDQRIPKLMNNDGRIISSLNYGASVEYITIDNCLI